MMFMLSAVSTEEESTAITRIFEQHYFHMKGMAFEILNHEQDAEDAVMDAMQRMCDHAERFVDYASPKTVSLIYLYLRSAAIDLYRRNRCRRQYIAYSADSDDVLARLPADELSISDIVISRENSELIMSAIEELDDIYRIPILLRYNYQMRNTEIAEVMHIDVNTVNGRLFRAKKLVEKILIERGYSL